MFQFIRRMIRGVMRSLLRRWILINRRDRYGRAGFVLPTVTMVLLVVVLLSLAITFRSFERAEDARFTQVSEQTLNAARPAIDRARAKISQALQTVTEISDEELSSTLETDLFKFADEEVVQVQYDINGNNSIDTGGNLELKQDEQIETAWRFPVDTDNNGDYDQFIVYGIFLRTPELGKPRTPLDARTLPQPSLGLSGRTECNAFSGGVDSLVTPEGLTPTRGKFKKSIFTYMINVPIDQETAQKLGEDYEPTQGSTGFSPLEYQQDWQLKPLNGVVYRDDLEISPGPAFNFNGSLLTTSNLMVSHFGGGLNLYLVSAKNSCFYDPDLSKITVGGNVMNGMAGNTNVKNDVEVHLFQPDNDDPIETEISTTNQSTGTSVQDAMYNDEPYRARLENLVQAQLAQDRSNDPPEVDAVVQRRIDEEGEAIEETARRAELTRYFRARLRKIPFSENVGEETDGNPLDQIKKLSQEESPIGLTITQLEASQPTDELKKTGAENYLGDRVLAGNNLPALQFSDENNSWTQGELDFGTWTDTQEDRTRASQADELPAAGDLTRSGFWESAAARVPQTLVEGTGGLRVITGGSVYERASSFLPPPINPTYDDPATSAIEAYPIVWPDTMPMSPAEGSLVYDNDPASGTHTDWISLTQWPLTGTNTGSIDPNTPKYAKGDLKMRATAVYHYAQDGINPVEEDFEQEPIACVSSYYDPTNINTAKNDGGWPSPNEFPKSDNGIVNGPPSVGRPGGASTEGTNGLLGGGSPSPLEQQANYVFPDGRFANQPLRKALLKAEADRTIAEKAAIDATLCSLGILGTQGYGLNASASSLPDGAIQEVTLLNAREVKTVHADNPDTDVDETFTLSSPLTGADAANVDAGEYDQPLENRQPLEIRVTQLNLNALRNATIANTTAGIDQLNPEYFLPYSGIIYASRDDALLDQSYREGNASEGLNEDTSKALSPVDFTLDPTRRPNGILLIHGSSLGRNDNQRPTSVEDVLKEKGLTLVSNLPVYIKGDDRDVNANEGDGDNLRGTFNKHTQEEFEEPFSWDFNNFYNRRETVNPNFACRAGDPIREDLESPCPNGDNWRPATVFADAITLLSDEFRLGYRNDGGFDLRNNAGNAVVGYDFNGNGTIDGSDSGSETSFNMDLNGDGDSNDPAVPGEEITAKVARQLNGFNAYNDFAINGLSSGIDLDDTGIEYETYTDQQYRQDQNNPLDSSYFNNFVTPVQRRGQFSEYVMEICLKLPVSACGPDDWSIDGTGTKASSASSLTTPTAGTTAQPPSAGLERFPRRVAFKRNTTATPPTDDLVLTPTGNLPIPLGIKGGQIIDATFANAATTPDTAPDALWFQTRAGGKNWGSDNPLWYYDPADPDTSKTFTATVQQPLLVPVLQLHATTTTPQGNVGGFPEGDDAQIRTRWLPRPSRNQEFNLVLGAGDVPGRPLETNGGLQNLARFLENFQQADSPQKSEINTTIKGSFVQSSRSSYATAPYIATKDRNNRDDAVIFGRKDSPYNFNNAGRRISYFSPPARDWGFDVGLLGQVPDYFSRKFARLDKDSEGNLIAQQYFRETGRDDRWVKGLLCGKVNGENVAPDSIRDAMNCSDGYE